MADGGGRRTPRAGASGGDRAGAGAGHEAALKRSGEAAPDAWFTRVRAGAKRVWNDEGTLGLILKRAISFAKRDLRIPDAEADFIATSAVSWAWEECKFGREFAEDEREFWDLVSSRLYKTRHSWRPRDVSLDAPLPNAEGDADGHAGGWNGYQPPNQFHVTFLGEVMAGIDLLPSRHAKVLRRVAEGHSAIDISQEMRLQLHTVFRIIREARAFLWSRDLIGMAKDNRRARDR